MEEAIEVNFPKVSEGMLSAEQRRYLFETMKDAVVRVEVYSKEYSCFDFEGAGVFISPQGHVLTLSSILDDDEEAQVIVRTYNNTEIKYGVSYLDKTLGLAILEVKDSSSSEKYQFAKISNKKVKISSQIYCIGHPGEMYYTFQVGHISHPCRTYGEYKKAMENNVDVGINEMTMDPYSSFKCHASEVYNVSLSLKSSVKLIQLNNVHGDDIGAARGMPVFNHLGHIIGMYLFDSWDQGFSIHAKTLRTFIRRFNS